jgi:hypothetical protein
MKSNRKKITIICAIAVAIGLWIQYFYNQKIGGIVIILAISSRFLLRFFDDKKTM